MTPLRPTDLRVQHRSEPLGVDDRRPVLSWVAAAGVRGARQHGYRIVVATSPERLTSPDMWDSGPVESPATYGIAYGGAPLASATRYWWAVRLQDGAGSASAWSEPSWFETALLDPQDWTARWIGAGESAAPLTQTRREQPVPLRPGHTLGQSFRTGTPIASLSVAGLGGESGGRCRARLHRDGPGGAVVAEAPLRAGDFFLTWMSTPLPAGRYYLELSDVDGELGWWGHRGLAPAWGEAFADGETVPGARALWVEPVPSAAPLLRREFTAPADLVRARLFATGLGYHELFLNGAAVGDAVLDPATTDYRARILYGCHDVTGLLRPGANAIGAMLGRGFYATRGASVWGWNSAPWNAEPALLCQVEMTTADGAVHRVVGDETWQVAPGPITFESLYRGEHHDARLLPAGWAEPGFDASGWSRADTVAAPTGRLQARPMPPIREKDRIEVQSVHTRPDGSRIHDFGRVTAGWTNIEVQGASGTEVLLRHGERLTPDGEVDNANQHVDGEPQTDHYVLAGNGVEQWRPRFTYKGFRYVQVESTAPLQREHLVARAVHSDVDAAGEFDCSDEVLNWIHDATRDTTRNNLHGIPTDTPALEKNGWTADAHLIAESAIYQNDMHTFFGKWLGDFADVQRPDGGIPVIVPSPGWGDFTDPCWSSAYLLIAWNLYEFYGDEQILAEHYEPMRRYVAKLHRDCRDRLWPGFSHADWLSPGNELPPEGPALAATAFVYHATRTMRRISEVLDRRADAERYAASAAAVLDAFTAAFLDRDTAVYRTGVDAGYRQTSNILPLAFGMVPPEIRPAVVDNLVRDVRDTHDGHLNTGAVGTKYLLPVLTEHGHGDLAVTVALQRTYPGWGFWREHGSSTLWEMWDEDARSRNHCFLGTATGWLYEHVAGIRPAAPGFGEITVRPLLDPRITRASARYRSVRGPVAVAWNRRGAQVDLEVTVPVGSRATVHAGPEPVVLHSGEHRITTCLPE